MDITKVKMANGKTLGQNLQDEAERLRKCIQNRLEEYLDGYNPIVYERTGGLRDSLQVDDFLNIRVVGNSLEIDLFFDDGAIHPSGDGIRTTVGTEWQGNGEEVNTAFLLNYGYEVKKDVWFKNIKNFGYRRGGDFVKKGIEDFNKSNKLGIKVYVVEPYESYV